MFVDSVFKLLKGSTVTKHSDGTWYPELCNTAWTLLSISSEVTLTISFTDSIKKIIDACESLYFSFSVINNFAVFNCKLSWYSRSVGTTQKVDTCTCCWLASNGVVAFGTDDVSNADKLS